MNEICRSAAEALAYVSAVPPSQGASMLGVPFEKLELVRIGFVGVGGRGLGLLQEMLAVPGARITAVCDIAENRMQMAVEKVTAGGQPAPVMEADWRALCQRSDVDLVYICSPWQVHVEQAVRAMECGKHAAVEVPAATTIAECWRLVDTSERTRRHCVMLENCCYGYPELLALNLVRKGRLGTITHGEAASIHDQLS